MYPTVDVAYCHHWAPGLCYLFLSCPLTWEEKEKNKFLIVIVQSAVLNVMNKTFISLMEHVGEMAQGMLIVLLT